MAHRLAWLYIYEEFPEKYIDHINCIRCDNKIKNLRCVSKLENSWNKRITKSNTYGVKGVHWSKIHHKWCARICFNKKRIHLGFFDDLEFAELVINEARDKYHKQFARSY